MKGKKQNRRYLSGLLEEGQELLCEAVSHGAGGLLGLFCLVIGSVFLTDGHNTKKERKGITLLSYSTLRPRSSRAGPPHSGCRTLACLRTAPAPEVG